MADDMLSEFMLIDLESQAYAVARYIKGWTRPGFLSWLSQSGDVISMSHDPDAYIFFSHVGLHTVFRMSEQGDFTLVFPEIQHMKPIAEGLFSS